MKKGLLANTALIGGVAILGGAVYAAEAPEWKLSGNMNFQFYYVDQDYAGTWVTNTWDDGPASFGGSTWAFKDRATAPPEITTSWGGEFNTMQDHGWYFGVDEAELQLNVSGTADNGLNYGFKIEINVNTDDGKVADEARIQLSGGWGTLQLGDEDGAEDVMNYGGENLMGATGGFDGDFDDVLIRVKTTANGIEQSVAPSYPSIVGDTSDATKISYFSPRFSGFQVGASITPQPQLGGDAFKSDGAWENHIGLGANYDNSFGGVRVRASAVYSGASTTTSPDTDFQLNDISAWSVGGIVGWSAFSLGANYTDNGDSGQWTGTGGTESSYWNVAASFETGPMYFSAGYFSSAREYLDGGEDSTFETISLTADYTAAPGLGFYAEIDLIDDDLYGSDCSGWDCDNTATIFIMGANVSF